MKKAKFKTWNIILLVVILLLIIPQTRHPLQLLLHKGLSYINQSSLINDNERITKSTGKNNDRDLLLARPRNGGMDKKFQTK